ncbi:hypothetical protein BKA63DRAFT_146411 [Paraphoma chrysanthemicola]|nr:hypothetical protein BKA63DRAFT_146411 [Paraphoma chrysanthemicola]
MSAAVQPLMLCSAAWDTLALAECDRQAIVPFYTTTWLGCRQPHSIPLVHIPVCSLTNASRAALSLADFCCLRCHLRLHLHQRAGRPLFKIHSPGILLSTYHSVVSDHALDVIPEARLPSKSATAATTLSTTREARASKTPRRLVRKPACG